MPAENNIDVSVVIATYNRLWSLPRAIDSCRGTLCKTEIIVVDDGSTDGTLEWLRDQKDIQSFYQANQGQTYAINFGVNQANGKYIRFLDSDDFLAAGIIDKQFMAAEEVQADLVYSGVDIYNEESKEITKSPEISPWDDFMEVQLGNTYGSHFLGMLFKTEWVKKIPRRPDFAFREDRMFLLEYGLLEPKIALVNGCAGYWVKHPDQMQANYSGLKSQVTNWQYINIYKTILSKLESAGGLTEKRKNAACQALWPAVNWIALDHLKDAEDVYKWIPKLNPDFKIPGNGFTGFLYKNFGFSFTQKILRIGRFIKYGWR